MTPLEQDRLEREPPRGGTSRRWASFRFFLFLAFVSTTVGWSLIQAGQIGLPRPEDIRASVLSYGIWGPAILIGVLTIRPFIYLPSGVAMVASGLAFGALTGALYCMVGFTLGCLVAYMVARILGRDFIIQKLGLRFAKIAESSLGGWLVMALMVTPVSPITGVAYAAGLGGVPAVTFTVASLAGLIPRILAFTALGHFLLEASVLRIALAVLALGVLVIAPLASARVRALGTSTLVEIGKNDLFLSILDRLGLRAFVLGLFSRIVERPG